MSEKAADQDTSWFNKKPSGSHQVRLRRGQCLSPLAAPALIAMMMSVSERVQEIGILLSIGTEKGEIRRMFLYEAFILGMIGAVIGGIMSIVIGYSVVSAMIGNTSYFFLPESIVYIPAGMLIGMIVCIVSGLYPAWRASNMDPIDALRNE